MVSHKKSAGMPRPKLNQPDVRQLQRRVMFDCNDTDIQSLRIKALSMELPETLIDAYDFARFVEGATVAMQFIDAAFIMLLECNGTMDDVYTMAEDINCVSHAFTVYWMEHANDMLREIDLSIDDVCPERISSATIALNVVASAEVVSRILRPTVDPWDNTDVGPSYETVVSATTTAESFDSVRNQLLVQTTKPILQYTPGELTRAIDALCRSWHRINVDTSVLRYVSALRLRYGMLIRCASPCSADISCDSEAKYYEDRVATESGCYRVPRVAFMEEMTHRFRTFMEIEWIRNTHSPHWTDEELRTRLDMSVERGAMVVLSTTTALQNIDEEGDNSGPSMRSSSSSISNINVKSTRLRRDEPEDNVPQFDPARGTLEVLKLLREYAELTKGGGTIYSAFRECYVEYLVCPGDDGVFRTRNPSMTPSTSNIIIALRGSKMFTEASKTTLVEPHEILQSALDTLTSPNLPSRRRMCSRSRYTLAQEVVGLCTFDCLMKGRFNIPWRERYIITRTTYRGARQSGQLNNTSLPVIIIVDNTYDVLYRGQLFKTNSVFESIAWWLEIMYSETNGIFPQRDKTHEAFELVGEDTTTDSDDESINYDNEGAPLRDLERKTKYIDAKVLCLVPRTDMNTFPLRIDRKRRCTVANATSFIPIAPSPNKRPRIVLQY